MAVKWGYRRREQFADAKGRLCDACGKSGLVSRKDCKGDFTYVYNIDHITPESTGGTDDASNLRLLCVSCNVRKYNLTEEEFQEKSRLRRESEDMIVSLGGITGIDSDDLVRVFGTIDTSRRHRVLSGILECLGSRSEADYGR